MRDDIPPVQQLYARVDAFDAYPPHVIRITAAERRNTTGFFPGHPGLWNVTPDTPLPRWPLHGVMLVGHNYDCEETFRRTQREPQSPDIERRWPPFRVLRLLLEQAQIQLRDCFFTNFFIGLKAGNRATGAFPGRHDPRYVAWCRALLEEEIRLQQPTLLLTLGRLVVPFLAQLEPLQIWSGSTSLRVLDERHLALVPCVQFAGCAHPTTVVALYHPSWRRQNIQARRYDDLKGDDAERELLRAGVQCSGYVSQTQVE